MNTYEQLDSYLLKGKNKSDRPLENNTRVIRLDNNRIGIKLWKTFVLMFDREEDSILINSDDYRTITTKDRINKYIPNNLSIYTKNSIWYLRNSIEYKTYFYQDNTKYNLDKKILTDVNNIQLIPISPELLKSKIKFKKLINDYCNKFVDLFFNNEIPKPDCGDCWFCLFIHNNSKDHLLSHLDESYYVPSLINNALRKYENKLSQIDKHNIACIWFNDDKKHKLMDVIHTKTMVTKILKKYMFSQLGFSS